MHKERTTKEVSHPQNHGNEPEVPKLTTPVHHEAIGIVSIPLVLHRLVSLLSCMSIFPMQVQNEQTLDANKCS